MKKVIFLTGRYLPKPEATGLCIHRIADCLSSKGVNVHTICIGDEIKEFEYDGVKIHQLKAPFFMRENEMSSFNVFVTRIQKLLHIFNYPLRSGSLRKRYYKKALELINIDDEVEVAASYSPFEAVSSLVKIKKKARSKSISINYYSADTLSNEQGRSGLLPASYRERKGKQQEIKIFKECKRIFIMDCHKDHYLANEFNDVKNKFVITDFPLLNHDLYSKKQSSDKSLMIAFIGTLYKSLRNPSIACDYFIKLKDFDYSLTFVGGGDCFDILETKKQESNGKINYLGKVSYKDAVKAMQEADVLLSIGNEESPMMPSKIYEYISTGKPIIHFSSWDGDPCIPVLKKYSNALIVDGNCDEKIFLSFIENKKTIDWNVIEKTFYMSSPSYTADYLESR